MEKKSLVLTADIGTEEEAHTPQTELRESLLIAGIAELEAHGPHGFSLRRVAAACGVSCAAPYKHFESKDAFISAILDYIHEKWELLATHICTAFPHGGRERLTELCLADIRFWLGNPHFYTVHMMAREKTDLGARTERELASFCAQSGKDYEACAYVLRSLVYGAVMMLEDGTLKNEGQTFRMLRQTITAALSEK